LVQVESTVNVPYTESSRISKHEVEAFAFAYIHFGHVYRQYVSTDGIFQIEGYQFAVNEIAKIFWELS
jgi:hypothetical protein